MGFNKLGLKRRFCKCLCLCFSKRSHPLAMVEESAFRELLLLCVLQLCVVLLRPVCWVANELARSTRIVRIVSHESTVRGSEIVFQLQPTPRESCPTTTDPPPRESISSRSFGRFRVVFESRLKIDSKTTEERLEIDSLGGGTVVVGHDSRGVGCSCRDIPTTKFLYVIFLYRFFLSLNHTTDLKDPEFHQQMTICPKTKYGSTAPSVGK